MKAREDMILRQIGDGWFLFPIGQALAMTNQISSLNEVGAFLYEALSSEQTVESLVALLLNEYDVDEKTATGVVTNFTNGMLAKGILRG